jgi:bla regulator protein BlaR1
MTTLQVLEEVVSPALVRGVGYALLHSLWQGGALALLLAGALPLLRRARPEVRYAASVAALVGLLLAVGGTFGYYYQHAPTPIEEALSGLPTRQQAMILHFNDLAASPQAPSMALLPALARQVEPYLPVLVAAWLLGLLLMGGRLVGGLVVANRLRRVGARALGADWQRRLAALASRAGLRRPVALLESGGPATQPAGGAAGARASPHCAARLLAKSGTVGGGSTVFLPSGRVVYGEQPAH